MSSDTPDTRPLERLWQAQEYALHHARRCYRSDLVFVGSTLTFRPDVAKRVPIETPILTDTKRLEAAHIRVPEWSHRSGHEWTLQIDMSYLFNIGDGLQMFGEFTMYTQSSLDRLTDDNPFQVAPTTILFPPLCDVAFS